MRVPAGVQMFNPANIFRRTHCLRILRTCKYESTLWLRCGHFEQPIVYFGLTIRSVGSHVTQIARITFCHLATAVHFFVEAAIKWKSPLSFELHLQLEQQRSSGETEIQIQTRYLIGAQIRGRRSCPQLSDRDGSVDIVKSGDGHSRLEREIDGSHAVGKIGADDSNVGVGELALDLRKRSLPASKYPHIAELRMREI